VVAVAGVLSACLPPAPAPSPTTTTTTTTTTTAPPAPTTTYTKGFDACAAPSLTTMSKWKTASPYVNVGIYIGGANRGCAQPNLTPSWITSAWGQGWKLLPIWVGPQAPCTTLSRTTKISSDSTTAFFEGVVEAGAAADAAVKLGMGWLTPIYFDMEAYPRGGSCTKAVQAFADGWVRQLNKRGYRAGMYSSLCSGVLDVAASVGDPSKVALNAVWIAAWNNKPQIYGFGPPCALSDSIWNDHQRVHQYTGGHDETYGGVTINIDSNAVDGPTG
jgi:Rv2525c-like, glycoside hydrolase-like domain